MGEKLKKELGRYKKKVADDRKEREKLLEEVEGYKQIIESYKSLLEAIIFKICGECGEIEIDLDDIKKMFGSSTCYETKLEGRKYIIKMKDLKNS